ERARTSFRDREKAIAIRRKDRTGGHGGRGGRRVWRALPRRPFLRLGNDLGLTGHLRADRLGEASQLDWACATGPTANDRGTSPADTIDASVMVVLLLLGANVVRAAVWLITPSAGS